MVAVNADHLPQLLFNTGFKARLILLGRRIGAGIPIAVRLESSDGPESILRPEHHTQPITSRGKRRIMRIVRAPDEIETRVLDHLHVALETGVGDSITPTGVVLMDVCSVDIKMLTIEEKSLVSRPLEPAESER